MTDRHNLRDKIARAMFEGHSGRSDPQAWMVEAYAEAADAVLAVIDVGEIRAEAWDEGYEAGMADDRQRNLAQFTPNPYRKAEQ